MSYRDSAPQGAPSWIELFSADADKTEAFYGALFGWTAEHAGPEYGGYINFHKDDRTVAGCMRNDGSSGMPDMWSVYLHVADAAATSKAVVEHGGAVMVPPMQVMNKGTMAVFTDAGHAGIGAWQPDTHKGFGVLAEHGAPGWFELHTRDYAATVQFYREVFGWDTHVASDTDQFRYTTLGEGDSQLAGIMDVSGFPAEQFPVGWSIYFVVDNADASIAQAVELGGSVVRPADDSPFGRLAELTDSTGARFKIVQG